MKSKEVDLSSTKQLIHNLRKLRSKWSELAKGHRHQQYELMAEAMNLAIIARSSVKSRNELFEQIPAIQKKCEVYAAIIFITRAKSERAKKLASKRAIALKYLCDVVGTTTSDIVKGLIENGGIQKLAKEAAASALNRSTATKTARGVSQRCNPTEFRKPAAKLKLSPGLASVICNASVGARFKLMGQRGEDSGGGVAFLVDRVIKLKKARAVTSASKCDNDGWN